MPQHREQRFLPYKPQELYNLVADVAKYPEFLPWCLGARLHHVKSDSFHADLIIGFKMFKERFTSHVLLTPHSQIEVDYVKGPLKRLYNKWTFDPTEGGTNIGFEVDFEFRNMVLEKLIGSLFEDSLFRMINAFETRAAETLDPFPDD